jgi:hypothetical protein
MSATLINSTVILNDILALLRTKCKALDCVNREFDDRFGEKATLKPGTSLSVRKPIQVVGRSGKKLDVQDTVEESVTINCSTQYGVDLPAFTSEQVTMNLRDFRKRYIEPTASHLASYIDKKILEAAALNFYQNVGTPGTTPATSTVLMQGGDKLTYMNAPEDDRHAIITPTANTALVAAFQGLYAPQAAVAGRWKTGMLDSSLGLRIGTSTQIHRVTCGTRVDTNIVVDENPNVNIAEGMNTIHIDGLNTATDTFKQGEKFTIAGVYAITPEQKINTGVLQQFTLTADAVGVGSECDIEFSPAIRSTGARANVDELPADGAEISMLGTASTAYPYNIIMHRDALTFVTADLPLPKNCNDAYRATLDNVSMRFIEDYNSTDDEFFTRTDIYYGITSLRPELGCVLFG